MLIDGLDVPPEQHEALKALRTEIDESACEAQTLDAITRLDLESEIQDWLDERGIAEPWEVAPRLVALGFTGDKLKQLDEQFDDKTFPIVIEWAAARGAAFPF